ncbi:general substrate transporter [Aulographum hederae CBS 113979]|uniref:General substrate transporter n=1 Tax=Aulographum hederae CBS 113979 TaxID=1176131 RepID=A0A6G1HF20_9PEZI|nr:general substrate transporter [Aulographum hederae CBS 113979]
MFTQGTSKLSGRWLNWAITAASCQGFLLLGYDQGVMSGIIGADNQFGRDFNSPDANLQGLIVSIYDIGCAVGSLISLFVAEYAGHKNMIMMGALTMIVGTAILASSTTVAQLLVGRIVTGIGNGFNSSNIPAYQSEHSGARNRGRLLSGQGVTTIVGLCIAYWMDFGLSFVDGPVQWRLPIAFQAFFAISLFLQMLPLPETPRFLVEKGRVEEASDVLAKLQGGGATRESPEVIILLQQIEESIERETKNGPFRYSELFRGGQTGNFRRIVLCCAVNIMQQFTGSNFINYYAPNVYQQTMGLGRTMSLILGGCTSLTYLLGSLIPLWTVDRFGRRALLMFSATGLCACFSLAAILLSTVSTTDPNPYDKSRAAGATAMVFLFQIFLGIGWLPIPWFYPSEVTTTRIRSKGQAIGSFVNWMCVFCVVQITPTAIENIAWRTFIIFAAFCGLWVPIVYCFFPETMGLELEDIDYLFKAGGITGGVVKAKGGKTVQPGQGKWEREQEAREKAGDAVLPSEIKENGVEVKE